MTNEEKLAIADELETIMEDMMEKVGEIRTLLAGTGQEDYAAAYWLAHMQGVIESESDYGGSLQQTINELREESEEDLDEE